MLVKFFGYVVALVFVLMVLLVGFVCMGCQESKPQDTSMGMHRYNESKELRNHKFWCMKVDVISDVSRIPETLCHYGCTRCCLYWGMVPPMPP